MAYSYICAEVEIKRQAGDTGSIAFVAPDIIDMDDFVVYFKVNEISGGVIFYKTPAEITVAGQNITIPLSKADTAGRSGVCRWEMEIESDTETITLGKGKFILLPEIIQR